MQIIKFKNMEEIIERANKTIYGLAASVFTKDLEKALYISNSVRAGTVWLVINITIIYYIVSNAHIHTFAGIFTCVLADLFIYTTL